MKQAARQFLDEILGSARDLAPIVIVIGMFQWLAFSEPLGDVWTLVGGFALVVLGLTFFVFGLKLALFPIGETLAVELARKGSLPWLLTFAFALGLGTTIAEPALIAVASEAADVAAQSGVIGNDVADKAAYALGLRVTVAASVGAALVVGVLRIVFGWSLIMIIIGGYALVVVMTAVAPQEIIGIAYDSGGVTTSTVTVPLVAALGVGLASALRDRNPMTDGFGLIALASLLPIPFVLTFGMIVETWIS